MRWLPSPGCLLLHFPSNDNVNETELFRYREYARFPQSFYLSCQSDKEVNKRNMRRLFLNRIFPKLVKTYTLIDSIHHPKEPLHATR